MEPRAKEANLRRHGEAREAEYLGDLGISSTKTKLDQDIEQAAGEMMLLRKLRQQGAKEGRIWKAGSYPGGGRGHLNLIERDSDTIVFEVSIVKLSS